MPSFEDYLNEKVGEVAGIPIYRKDEMSIPRTHFARDVYERGRSDGVAEGYAKAMETLAAPSIKTKHKPAA